jgi:cysteine desulfurase
MERLHKVMHRCDRGRVVLIEKRVFLLPLDQLIDDNTVLLSIMYANNELGTIQPIRKIAEIVQNHRSRRAQNQSSLPLYLHTDACQATPYLDLHVSRLGVDMMTINASKMYGPKQVSALYVKTGTRLSPLIFGGGQERGLRSGTENVPGIIGLAAALDVVQGRRHDESRRLAELQRLIYALIEQKVPTAVINGSTKHRLPNNVHLTISGQDNERLMMLLDEAGVQVAVGSACSASSDQPSHVLAAIGLSDEAARASLRLTMGHSTDENAIRTTVDLLAKFTTNSQE